MPHVQFEFDLEKAAAAVAYLAQAHLPELTKGKVCKLLFLADRLHLVRYGRPITGDALCALEHGPIPSRTLNALNALIGGSRNDAANRLRQFVSLDHRFSNPQILPAAPPDIDCFSRSDIRVMNEVIREHGHKTFAELRALTHDFKAWKLAWANRGASDSAPIRFEDLFEDDDADDSIAGVRDELRENAAIREALTV